MFQLLITTIVKTHMNDIVGVHTIIAEFDTEEAANIAYEKIGSPHYTFRDVTKLYKSTKDKKDER